MSSSVLHRRKKSYRFGTTWGWENEDSIFNFGFILTFQSVFLLSLCHENMGRGFRGNNEIVFKCFRTSLLYSDRLEDRSVCGYGWHLPWILTIALTQPCTHTSAFTLLPEHCSRQLDHPRPALVFMSIWVCSSRFKSTLKAMWRVKTGLPVLTSLRWAMPVARSPGLGLLDTSTLATGQCRLTRLTLRVRSLHAVFGSTSGCVSHTM